MMNDNNNHGGDPMSFDLDALSKAYEQSLNNVGQDGYDEAETQQSPQAAVSGKDFVPKDFHSRSEDSAEHDKIVDKIREERRKRSHSIWTDTPLLKPKKSVWIDDTTGEIDVSAVKKAAAKSSVQKPAKAARPQRPAQPVQEAVRRPEPQRTMPPQDDELILPILSEPPHKQELVMDMDSHGVRRVPNKVNKQKLMLNMSSLRRDNSASDSPNKRTVSINMPLNKMKFDDLFDIDEPTKELKKNEEKKSVPEPKKAEEKPAAETKKAEPKEVSIPKAEPRTQTAPKADTAKAEPVKAAQKTPAKPQAKSDAPVTLKNDEDKAEKPKAAPKPAAKPSAKPADKPAAQAVKKAKPAADRPAAEAAKRAKPQERPVKKAGTARPAQPKKSPAKKQDDEYNFSDMINRVHKDKAGSIREEYEKEDKTHHTQITEKAQLSKEARQVSSIKPRRLTKRRKPNFHELEFRFINCIMSITVVLVIFFTLLFMERTLGYSPSEQRELASFPEFSWEDLVSGKYAQGIDEFFTDTVPGRESFKQFGEFVSMMRGIDADNMPAKPEKKAEIPADEEPTAEETVQTTAPEEKEPETVTETAPAEEHHSTGVISDTVTEISGDLDDCIVSGEIIFTGEDEELRALAGFNGQFDVGTDYAHTLNKYKEALSDVNVYNMTIPTAAAYYLPKDLRTTMADQKDNTDNIAAELKGVINADVYDTLSQHTEEYIYSRSDHRWQPRGAYYAGKVFADKAGVKYPSLDTYTEYTAEGFTGSLAKHTDDSRMNSVTDQFIYYKPENEYTVTYLDKAFTNAKTGDMFFDDVQGAECFGAVLGNDDGIVRVTTDCANGRTLVIMGSSSAKLLVPFFTHSFETIYFCDYRSFTPNAVQFCKDVGCTDLLFSLSVAECSSVPHITAINNDRVRAAAPVTVPQAAAEENTAPAETETANESSTEE